MAIKLGSRVKDSISGFTGIATARVEYMYGCARILIEAEQLRDGKHDDCYFDEQRVVVLEERVPEVSTDNSATTGGPQNDPPQRADPARR
jgi:hypothetical protein